jgi:hypothetical protein
MVAAHGIRIITSIVATTSKEMPENFSNRRMDLKKIALLPAIGMWYVTEPIIS